MAEHLKDSVLHGSDHLDPHASDSRWRHQESHSFAEHARHASKSRDTSRRRSSIDAESDYGDEEQTARKSKTAGKHLSFTTDLADFLNSSRIEAPSDGVAKGKHKPLLVKGSHGEEFAEGTAARSSDGHMLQEEVAAIIGRGFGWEVRCGPLLNYRRMENEVWYGSVLIVVKTTEMAEDNYAMPVLKLTKDSNWEPLHGNGVPTSVESALATPTATRDSEEFATPRTTASAFPGIDNEISWASPVNEKFNHTGDGPVDNLRSPAHHSLGEQPSDYGVKVTSPTNFNSEEAVTRVTGTKLYSDSQNTFYRFDIEVPMLDAEQKISYTIPDLHFPIDAKKTGSQHFYIPAKTESMRIMFHSCNGFSVGTDEEAWSGACLWKDVSRVHEKRPLHVMIGGGDQIYNDGIRVNGPLRKWTDVKNPIKRREYPFPESLRKECDEYYSKNYIRWYSTEPFSSVNGQIPQLNLWDDHDIIDGFGSYVKEFMLCPVFRGIGGVAYKYYMLFQHHLAPPPYSYTTDAPQTMAPLNGAGADPVQSTDTFVYEEKSEDPSYIIGAKPGPYVAEHSRSIYARLGARIAFFGIDARTERTRHQVNYPETYDLIFTRLRKELSAAASTTSPIQHLIVLLGIPIAYPRLTWLENIFTSPVMGPIKFLNKRFGLAGGLFNHFDGSVDLLDDLDDHYTARAHKKERHMLVERFQALAAEFSVRISILGGDVHLAAVGRFYSNPRLGIPISADHRYMANIISSAIVNKPPPNAIANLLARRNKIHHLDSETDETLLKLFDRDPGSSQKTANSNHVTMPSRNWALITENSANNSLSRATDNSSEASTANGEAPISNGANTLSPNQTNHANGYLAVNGSSNRPTTAATSSTSITNKIRKIPSTSIRSGRNRSRNSNSSASIFKDGHFPLHPGEEGAGTSHRAAGEHHGMAGDGSLDVMIRVEINQHDKQGKTCGYGLQIPLLTYKASMAPLIMRSDEVLVEHKARANSFVPPAQVDNTNGELSKDITNGNGSGDQVATTIANPAPLTNIGNGQTMARNTTSESTELRRRETTGTQTEQDQLQPVKTQSTSESNYSNHGTQTDAINEAGHQPVQKQRESHLFENSSP